MNIIAGRKSFIHSINPCVKIIIFTAFALFFCFSKNFYVLSAGLLLSFIFLKFAKIRFCEIRNRLTGLNFFVFMIFLLVPINSGGNSLYKISYLSYEFEGLVLAAKIALKSNIILIFATVFITTIDINHLGHALNCLRISQKLSLLMVFTVHYLEAAGREYKNMIMALKARGFRPGLNTHTYKTFANFAAMLLIRGYDRSEKIMEAMKCRCFHGKFYITDNFSFKLKDKIFTVACFSVFLVFLGGEIWLKEP